MERIDEVGGPTAGGEDRPSRRSRWRWGLGAAAVLGVGLVVFVLVWFQPQKLIIDDRVAETLPGTVVPGATGAEATPVDGSPTSVRSAPSTVPPPGSSVPAAVPGTEQPALVEELRGAFRGLEHGTSGDAIVYRRSDGSRLLRLEDLDTSNGPDLRVILSSAPVEAGWSDFGDDYVEIDHLKGNQGSQNYELQAGIDLAQHGRVVIWCKRFEVGFGVAGLT